MIRYIYNDVSVAVSRMDMECARLPDGRAVYTFRVRGSVSLGSMTVAEVGTRLLVPRRPLTIKSSGSVLVQVDGADADDGPKPIGREVVPTPDGNVLVSTGCTTTLRDTPEDDCESPLVVLDT